MSLKRLDGRFRECGTSMGMDDSLLCVPALQTDAYLNVGRPRNLALFDMT